jgi:hypothetical protein
MLEARMTDDDLFYDLVDETGRVGSVFYMEPDEDDPTTGWVAVVHRARFTGQWQSKPAVTVVEALAAAHAMHANLVQERRELARYYRAARLRVVSIPMGGKPRR